MEISELGNAKYIALETFRKNGEGVITPVWVTMEGDKLYVWTMGDSWKVKRIRKNSRVRLAVSDVRGNPKSEWIEATATVLDSPEDEARQRQRLASKYRIMYRLFALMYKIRRDDSTRVAIEISEPATH
jgi:PPOX class probable F420-dependent enzyme